MLEIRGIAAAPGYAIGRARVLREAERIEMRQVGTEAVHDEQQRFEQAVTAAEADVACIAKDLLARGMEAEAEIVSSQQLFLQDEELIGRARELIGAYGWNAESAMQQAADEVAAILEALEDTYLRERAADIRDVTARVIGHLQTVFGTGSSVTSACSEAEGEPVVLLARELSPTRTAQLNLAAVAAFATIDGGAASHSAIIARSLGVPAVVGGGAALAAVEDGAVVAVDGGQGVIVVDPPAAWLDAFRAKQERYAAARTRYAAYARRSETLTADGARVELAANIGSPQEAEFAQGHGAEGVGLFRTEFLFMGRNDLPDEEEQFEAYRAAARVYAESGGAVIIRTMDVGGDKELPQLGLPAEDNPFLGFRAIRIGLERPELLKTQLRAVLRASAYGNVKIMFPMIATLAEWRAAVRLLEEAQEELAQRGAQVASHVERGMMIEVPAAALQAERFAREVDFFSIGTNDLVQYTMAADRMNRKVARLSDPLHPSVLQLIRHVIGAAHRAGKWTGMCGEMACDPLAVPLLLGMGLDEFSMSSIHVARTRALIAGLRREELAELPAEAVEKDSAEEVRRLIRERVPIVNDYLE